MAFDFTSNLLTPWVFAVFNDYKILTVRKKDAKIGSNYFVSKIKQGVSSNSLHPHRLL